MLVLCRAGHSRGRLCSTMLLARRTHLADGGVSTPPGMRIAGSTRGAPCLADPLPVLPLDRRRPYRRDFPDHSQLVDVKCAVAGGDLPHGCVGMSSLG